MMGETPGQKQARLWALRDQRSWKEVENAKIGVNEAARTGAQPKAQAQPARPLRRGLPGVFDRITSAMGGE